MFNRSHSVTALTQLCLLLLASELRLLFEDSHTMLLRFTFDIFCSHRFTCNSSVGFTAAVSGGVSQSAHPRGAATQLDMLPGSGHSFGTPWGA